MTSSEHFFLEEWADFVRAVAEPLRQDAMQRHLETGCPPCTELHDSLRAVDAVARADAQYEPPASTMRLARALYSQRKPAGVLERAMETVKLLFDSHASPLPAGVRGGPARPRALLFESGDHLIDLQVMPSHERTHTVLIGQITSPSDAGRHVDGVPVLLQRGVSHVARAATSRRGEFQMEFDGPIDGLSLTIGAGRDITLISLRTLTKVPS
jgi:hypothetical protein